MANMPAFAEASAIARDRGLLDHVGAHLVLTEGDPLTDTMRRCGRFCDADGGSRSGVTRTGRCGSRPTSGAPSPASCARQIARCRESGLPVTHVDTHHNVHNQPGIAPLVLELPASSGCLPCASSRTPRPSRACATA